MIGRGFQFDFSHTKYFSCAISHLFILGLILARNAALSSHVQAPSVKCSSDDISPKYQHCGSHPDGVHDLDCFRKSNQIYYTCVWKSGKHASQKTYTLVIKQDKRSHRLCNVTGTSLYPIKLYKNYNMTAEVFEHGDSTNCTKAEYSGSPKSLWRCGPPYNVSFSRLSGRLVVNVSWQQEEIKSVKNYSVRYKAQGSLLWSKSTVQCQKGEKCTVENLNSSLVYTVQVQCVANDKCSQCVWSEAYTVPTELTTPPVIANLEDTDIAERKGKRRLYLTWKFPATELYDGYSVTAGKVSGEEPCERMSTTQPEITLILSYSAYHLNISAVNNASTSPAASQIIPQREDEPSMGAGKLNMTFGSNSSFMIYWKDDLIKKYVCYSAEWMKKGRKAVYMSFYQNQHNHRTLTPLPEPLEPYVRYSITLHTRPNKDTCNMKYINNSESTYGRTQFYFIEGSPTSAPINISSSNVTLSSVVLQWSSIPEEDIRGFLLGYIIHYSEYHHTGTSTERNITVDPELNSYELGELSSSTAYKVQMSGFTKEGAGERSKASFFKTNQYPGYSHPGGTVIIVFAVLAAVLIFGSPIIKRAKVILWPSIPNPGKSKAMQKIDAPYELELLESINTLKVEEWDTNSLQIVEKEDVTPASTLPSMLPLLHASEDEEDSLEMTCDWTQRDTEDATEDILPDITADTFPDIQQSDLQTCPLAFPSGYTTMEMFQQVMPQPANTSVTPEPELEETDLTAVKSGLDYIRQFSTSPILDSEDMSTIFEFSLDRACRA